jgi:glutamine amidotransferase
MHNGGLGGWKYIKRRLGQRLADKWYLGVHGGTDSEWAFALFLDTLERMGYDPSSCPEEGFGPGVLRTAMLKTIEQINEFIAGIPERTINEENVDTRSLLNFALTDGHSVVCTRYVSSKSDEAASLFYSSGTSWRDKEKGKFQMDRRDKGADIVLVASEPLTFERDNWVIVPTNSILTIHKQTVMIHPIVDKYYNYNPYYNRSAKFAVEQGLVASTTIPPTPQNGTPLAPTPNPLDDPSKRAKILDTIFRNRSPARSPAPDSGSTIVSHPTPVLTSPSTNVPRSYSESSPSSNPDSQSQSQSSSRRVKKEQGNTKKKRRSLPQSEMAQPERNAEQAVGTVTPEERPSYGDPSKIAQFFPELNLPRRGGRATHD